MGMRVRIYERNVNGAVVFAVLTGIMVGVTALLLTIAITRLSVVLGGLGVITLGLAMLGAYESYALAFAAAPPITWIARFSATRSFLPWIAVVFLVQTFAGLLAGHFFWPSICVPIP
jgi:hypothetical protein